MVAPTMPQPSSNETSLWESLTSSISNYIPITKQIAEVFYYEGTSILQHTLPANIKWIWKRFFTREIQAIKLQPIIGNVKKVAYLYMHGRPQIKKDSEVKSALFIPGDYCSPYALLPLIEHAKNQGIPTFSLYIPDLHDNDQIDIHDSLLGVAIQKIKEEIIKAQAIFNGILGTGHSKGAILLTHRQFVSQDPAVLVTCAIASRLNAPTTDSCSDVSLRRLVKKIYIEIKENSDLPLFQIIPDNDWKVSKESMKVRDQHCYNVPGAHLGCVYTEETSEYLQFFLKYFLENDA